MDAPSLDPVLHQAQRLRIMTLLFKNRDLAVATIKRQLVLTDGNLASHLKRLGEAGYVKTRHLLLGVSFESHAAITAEGSTAFRDYLKALRNILETAQDPLDENEDALGTSAADELRPHVKNGFSKEQTPTD